MENLAEENLLLDPKSFNFSGQVVLYRSRALGILPTNFATFLQDPFDFQPFLFSYIYFYVASDDTRETII